MLYKKLFNFVTLIKLTKTVIQLLSFCTEVSQAFEVEFDEYFKKLTDQQSCRLTVVVEIIENGEMFTDDMEFDIDNKPAVKILVCLSF